MILANGCGQAAFRAPGYALGAGNVDESPETSSLAALRTAVLSYAGRYRETIAFAIDQTAQYAETPMQRYSLQVIKVAYVTGALTNATGPDAVIDLRNLVVEAQLERIVWNDPKVLNEFPAPVVESMRDALARVEADIRDVASAVVRPETLDALGELVLEWREANPNQEYVAFVQLDTERAAKIDDRWQEDARRGGFLAPVNEAARQIQMTREAAERALLIANLMPMLLEWNAELVVLRTLATPEADMAGQYSARMVVAAEELQKTVAALPDRIEEERVAVLQQFASLVRGERRAMLDTISDEAANLRPLFDSLSVTSAALRDTLTSLERLFPPDPLGEPGGGDGMASLEAILINSVLLSQQLGELLDEIQPLIEGATPASGLVKLEASLERYAQRLFLYMAALLVLAALLAALVFWFSRRLGVREQ